MTVTFEHLFKDLSKILLLDEDQFIKEYSRKDKDLLKLVPVADALEIFRTARKNSKQLLVMSETEMKHYFWDLFLNL